MSPTTTPHLRVRRALRAVALTVVVGIAYAACGQSDEQSSRTFFYNEADGLNTLDPAKIGARAPWQIGGQIFIGLVGLDSALRPTPLIARTWSVSDDGLRWRFNLRSDAYFADDAAFPGGRGRAVTAEDVRYSFERICDPTVGSTGYWVFRGKVRGADEFFESRRDSAGVNPAEHVEGFRVVNDTTFEIELLEPFAPFLSMLSIPYCYIVPREAVERYGQDFFRHPVGAGPFRLVEWTPDQRLVLARNTKYFERDADGAPLPYLDTVVVSFLKEAKSEFLEFREGRLDAVSSIDPAFVDEVLAEGGRSLTPAYAEFTLHTSPAMSVEYYGFLLDSTLPGANASPFVSNRHLRLALNHAIDRESLVRYVLKGRGLAGVHGPVPPGTPGFSGVKGYTFDRELARRHLDSAGFPDGKGLPRVTLQLGYNERTATVAEAVQDQLKAVGISIDLKQVDFPQHREMIISGKLPFWRTSWMADYPDAENFLALFHGPYAAPRGPNTTHFVNARLDSLYRAALDPRLSIDQRSTIYGDAERIVIDNAPWVILYYSVIQRLTQPWIRGYVVDPLDRLDLTRVRKS